MGLHFCDGGTEKQLEVIEEVQREPHPWWQWDRGSLKVAGERVVGGATRKGGGARREPRSCSGNHARGERGGRPRSCSRNHARGGRGGRPRSGGGDHACGGRGRRPRSGGGNHACGGSGRRPRGCSGNHTQLGIAGARLVLEPQPQLGRAEPRPNLGSRVTRLKVSVGPVALRVQRGNCRAGR